MRHRVTLVIPVRDEERSIGPLLDSVISQQIPPDEIVITDGGSKDATAQVIESYIARGYPIRLMRTDGAYPGRARNIGIENATGDLVALTDAGIVLDRLWLSELLKKMDDGSGADLVFGVFEPRTDTLFKKYSSLVFTPKKRIIDGQKMRTFSVASMILKRQVWEDVGGFPDLRSAEDKIFLEKVREKGYAFSFAPQALAIWDVPGNIIELFSKFYLYSYHGLIAGRMRDWHLPVIRIYSIILLCVLLGAIFSPLFLLAAAVLLVTRALRLVRQKSDGTIAEQLNPVQFIYVFLAMMLVDFALFCGIGKFVISKYLTGKRS